MITINPPYKLRGLELFSGSQTLRRSFESRSHSVISLDNTQYRNSAQDTILCDFLHFDYKLYPAHFFDWIWIGLPCDAFSKASGGFHFGPDHTEKTDFATLSVEMMKKSIQLTKYFNNSIFFFENPAGGLVNHPIMKDFILKNSLQVIRIHLGQYGFKTAKQTDIITNSSLLWVDNRLYRKNGRYQKFSFDNLSDHQIHTYPEQFCNKIVDYTEKSFLHHQLKSI